MGSLPGKDNMRTLLIFFLFFSICFSLDKFEQFKQFKSKYNKLYKSYEEESLRYSIFLQNLAEVEAHNQADSTYTKGINEWSDLSQSEWETLYLGGYKHMAVHSSKVYSENTKDDRQLPGSFDWRDHGMITPVKNQGQCGSCWAFATTEQIEAYSAIANGPDTLTELSAQQVTSCTPNPLTCGGTGGCMGSTPPLGYNYVQLFGQVTEADYPYMSGTTMETEDCMYNLASLEPVVSITGYNNLPPNDQGAIMSHIAHNGPLAISVAASNFKNYHGGVFDGCSYDENIQLNHAVQLVGWGSENGVDFWIVRNSWGSTWGEEGYIRLLREENPGCGTDTTTSGHVCQGGPGNDMLHVCGMCGMLFETSFPLGAHKL